MYENIVVNPPYIGEIGMTENIEEMLFGTSIGQRFHESMVEEGGNDNCEKNEFNNDEEADFEEHNFPGSEPIPDAHFQGITSYDQSNWRF